MDFRKQVRFSKYRKYQSQKPTNLPESSNLPESTNSQSSKRKPTVFFNDGQRKIDYVLVYSRFETERDRHKRNTIATYLSNIKLSGFQIEEEEGLTLDDLVCVKVHAPKSILNKYTSMFKLELSQNNPNFKYSKKIKLKWMRSIVTCPDINDPVYYRARDTLSGNPPTDYTDAERIYIVHQILCSTNYSVKETEIGYERLIKRGIFLAVYPLHDSGCEWPDEGPLTDRQLLAKYWASIRYWYKYQPLTIIEKYYGAEVAFYFAWLGFYTKMLLPVAVMGGVCFIGGVIYYTMGQNIEEEVCTSDQMLCPVCPSDDWCSFIPLSSFCSLMKLAHILENPVTVLYSTIMSFWGIIFMVSWKRKQAMLKVRWNLQEHREEEIREEFITSAPLTRISSLTGNIEYYFPFWQKLIRHIISYGVTTLVYCMYCLAIIVVMYYRLNVTYYGRKSLNKMFIDYLSLFESISSAFLTYLIMAFFDSVAGLWLAATLIMLRRWSYGLSNHVGQPVIPIKYKSQVCQKLTELESPRTQREFNRLYALKVTAVSFGNTFFPIAYLAFVKGHFYTYPGDETQWTFFGMFRADVCKVSGCLVDLSIQVAVILILRNGMRLFTEIMVPIITVFLDQCRIKGESSAGSRWEDDFMLMQTQSSFLYSEYTTVVLQYGFMTFFLVSLPIAPLLAFLNNIIELRMDALKMLKNYRRMVPRKVTGIEEWNVVLQVITILGTISNPLAIAFGSNFIPRYIYWLNNDYNSEGFINSTLSEFAVKDFPGKLQMGVRSEVSTCQYVGQRNPPWHPEKYQRNINYWHQFAMKSVFFMILENVCLLFSLFLKYVIPDIPRKVQLRLEHDQKLLLEARLRGVKD